MKPSKKSNVKTATVLKSDKEQSSYYDFMAILFILAYLVIDFLPYFGRAEILKPQFFYLNCLNAIIAVFIYLNRSHYSASIIAILKKSYPVKAYLLFVLICCASVFWAKNATLALNGSAEILVVFVMIVNFVFLLYNRLHLIYKIAFIVSLVAFFQTFPVLLKLKSTSNSDLISAFLYSEDLKGNTGNINIFAASVMVKIPFVLIGLHYFKQWKRLLLSVVLLSCLLVVFFIVARTALLSLVFVLITYAYYLFRANESKKNFLVQLAYVLIPLLIAYSFTNQVFKNLKNNDSRYTSAVGRLKEINAEGTSANLRLKYWHNSLKLAKEHPVLGVGFGNYRVEVIPYEFSNNVILSLHSHNDFLEITAETGFVNGLIFFSVFVVLFFINAKRALKNKGDTQLIAALSLMLFIVYFNDSFFNFPMFRPTMQLGFSFLMALTIINHKDSVQNLSAITKKAIWTILALAILPIYVTYYANETSLLENKIKADGINENTKGALKGDDVAAFGPKIPNVFTGSESFDEYTGIYYFREKKFMQALKYLDKGNKINPYLGRTEFYKFLVAKEMGNLDSAYVFVKNAISYRPSTGFYVNAIDMATKMRDSIGILKMYNKAIIINKDPALFAVTFNALKNINFSVSKLKAFGEEAKVAFDNNAVVNKTLNDYQIGLKLDEGQHMLLQGKPAKALQKYEEALRIDASNVYVLQNIGIYYFNNAEYGKSIDYLLRVLKNPDMKDGRTEYLLSLCYAKLNDKVNSCKYLKIAYQKKFIANIPNADCK